MLTSEEDDGIKKKKNFFLEKIKEKLSYVENLKEQKIKEPKKRLEIDKKIKIEDIEIEDIDNQLHEVTREEKQILLRILKLSEFLIKHFELTKNGIALMI